MAGYQSAHRVIAAHQQPAVLIDLVRAQGIDLHRLLRHTGLFHEQIVAGDALISPHSYRQLIHNARRLHHDPELSFRYGQRLFPGHYGAVSALLGNATNLKEALNVFADYPLLISPLLGAHLVITDDYICLQWLDSCGSGNEHRFLIESTMSGVASVTRWLSGERLPWMFQFSYACPDYPEQYEVHLSGDLHFQAHMNAMILPREYLLRPWPRGAATAALAARQHCDRQLGAAHPARRGMHPGHSLRMNVYHWLWQQLDSPPSLQDTARHFQCSPATLKRRLSQHGCHYQQLLDEARLNQAIHWLQFHGDSTELVARRLNFHDATNFRRSFKRWSGLTPAACQRALATAMRALN